MKLFVPFGLRTWLSPTRVAGTPEGWRPCAVKRLIATTTLLLCAPAAVAQPLNRTSSLRCKDAAALVASSGAVVLGTGPHTYERFVGGAGCGRVAREEPAWVATLDTPQCFVGYRCREKSN
jgi:hypothetical protein